MKSLRRLLIILPFLFIIACSTTDILGGFNVISPEQESQLGAQLAQDIARQKTIITDPEINNYISAIGRKLVSVSLTPNEEYRFHVLQENQVNAFAIPGGQLYVQTGLIAAAESEAELAAVMAHELGHAEKRHPTQSMSRQMSTQYLMSIILGENPSASASIAASLLANGGLSAYSRSAELEADNVAVHVLNRAGYNPTALNTFFQKLVALEQQGGGGRSSMFASHPPTQDRIAAANNLIQSFGSQRASGTEIIGGFEQVQARVRAIR